jgi:hypothetical protein
VLLALKDVILVLARRGRLEAIAIEKVELARREMEFVSVVSGQR